MMVRFATPTWWIVVLGNSIYEDFSHETTRVFRSSTPSLRRPEARSAQTRHQRSNVAVSLPSAIGTPRRRDAPQTNRQSRTLRLGLNSTSARFRQRGVHTDDEARQPLGSRRSARPLVLGRGVTRACPSPSPGACDSDDNSLRIFGGGETSRLR